MTQEEREKLLQAVYVRPTKEMLEDQDLIIIDIRTEMEWRQTGIVQGSHCITFFDDFGNYDVDKFLQDYQQIADKESLVGLICRTGSRTRMVTNFLRQNGYNNVINLDGGVFYLNSIGFELSPYQSMKIS